MNGIIGRVVRWTRRAPRAPAAWVVLALLAAITIGVAAAPDDLSGLRHLMYLPILLAAVRFGPTGGAVTAMAATLLAGPLVASSPLENWATRGVAFVGIALLVGVAVNEIDAVERRREEVARRERELRDRGTAIVQLVSHEFRTPLTVIRGGIQTLRYYGGVDPSLGDVADAVDRAVARLDDMLSVVLVAADALDPAGEPPEVVDLGPMLERVVATLPPDQRGRVRTHVEGGTGRVVAVVRAIELILWFLLDNALRFSPEGTTVEVTARVAIRHVVFDVSDHGPGIPAEYMNWAFDPFTQADTSMVRERSGLGMGLYTARRLARRLGGDLTVASSDAGVLASVVLPRRPDLPAGSDEPSIGEAAEDRVVTVADIVRPEPDFFGFLKGGGAVSP